MKLTNYLPWYYEGIGEFDLICKSEQSQFDRIKITADNLYNDRFVSTATERGVKRYERIVEVAADEFSENLEFRKQRIVNRLTILPPLTMRFLRQKLDGIVGVGLYSIDMDYANYIITVTVNRADRNWYNELKITLEKIKPCNIVTNYQVHIGYSPLGKLYFPAVSLVKINCKTDILDQLG